MFGKGEINKEIDSLKKELEEIKKLKLKRK